MTRGSAGSLVAAELRRQERGRNPDGTTRTTAVEYDDQTVYDPHRHATTQDGPIMSQAQAAALGHQNEPTTDPRPVPPSPSLPPPSGLSQAEAQSMEANKIHGALPGEVNGHLDGSLVTPEIRRQRLGTPPAAVPAPPVQQPAEPTDLTLLRSQVEAQAEKIAYLEHGMKHLLRRVFADGIPTEGS